MNSTLYLRPKKFNSISRLRRVGDAAGGLAEGASKALAAGAALARGAGVVPIAPSSNALAAFMRQAHLGCA
jgi:hypothetical protein